MARDRRLKELGRRWLRPVADVLVASSGTLRSRIEGESRRTIGSDPRIAAILAPYRAKARHVLVPPGARDASAEVAVPPESLWIFSDDSADDYLALGRCHVETMLHLLADSGVVLDGAVRILDFGCGAGRMIRWLGDHARAGEVWGVDLNGDAIAWCNHHLSPPFRFVTSTSFPHLPFEDDSFDLVYASGVFLHLADLADAWFLELRRILKPGAALYATVHDEHSVELILNFPEGHRYHQVRVALEDAEQQLHFLETPYSKFVVDRPGASLVFYDLDSVIARLGCWFEVVSTTREAEEFLTAVVLRKRIPM